ncbi:MAG: hypothetical protein MI725_01540 [Pirellulales bacterium]|nr:hypothetical protein [Pirellulales bacterium]
MDWTDKMMQEPSHQFSIAASQRSVACGRVVTVQGITLLQVDAGTHQQVDAALEVLRGFRATGRRVVLCDTSGLVVGRQFGSHLVECGSMEMLVSCGLSGREIAIGARDAGLSLANVVVCSQPSAACEVLTCRLVQGDTVLLLGIEEGVCDQLVAALDKRLSVKLAAA